MTEAGIEQTTERGPGTDPRPDELDIWDVTRDPGSFCSGRGVSLPFHGMPPLPPIESDPPAHARKTAS
jgi:hypothetical protein